jgi:ketosteroid isomerase-like protein
MSQENVEVVRRMCKAFLAGDVADALDVLHADVTWHGTIGGLEEGRTAHGHNEVIEGFIDSLRDWERHSLDVEAYLDAGDRVVVLWHERGRGKRSGVEVETRTAVIYTVRGDEVIEVQGYMDRQQASKPWGCRSSRCCRRTSRWSER